NVLLPWGWRKLPSVRLVAIYVLGGPAFHLRRSDEQSVRNRNPGIGRFWIGSRASTDNTSHHPSRTRYRRLAGTCRPAAAAHRRAHGMVGWPELCSAKTNNV